jgi:hypothetical protein
MSVCVHVLTSDSPLRSGVTYRASCGKEIHRAEWAFVADPTTFERQSSLQCKCWDGPYKKYIYGAISGEEAKQEGF